MKTRKQMAYEYGITEKTFRRHLKIHKVLLPKGSICPKHQKLIYERLGNPNEKIKAQKNRKKY